MVLVVGSLFAVGGAALGAAVPVSPARSPSTRRRSRARRNSRSFSRRRGWPEATAPGRSCSCGFRSGGRGERRAVRSGSRTHSLSTGAPAASSPRCLRMPTSVAAVTRQERLPPYRRPATDVVAALGSDARRGLSAEEGRPERRDGLLRAALARSGAQKKEAADRWPITRICVTFRCAGRQPLAPHPQSVGPRPRPPPTRRPAPCRAR
jgi:hypothetical protein